MFEMEWRNGKLVKKKFRIEDYLLHKIVEKLNSENYSEKELNAMHPAQRLEILRKRSKAGTRKARKANKKK